MSDKSKTLERMLSEARQLQNCGEGLSGMAELVIEQLEMEGIGELAEPPNGLEPIRRKLHMALVYARTAFERVDAANESFQNYSWPLWGGCPCAECQEYYKHNTGVGPCGQ